MFVHGAKLAFSLQIDTVWGHLLDSLCNGSLRLPRLLGVLEFLLENPDLYVPNFEMKGRYIANFFNRLGATRELSALPRDFFKQECYKFIDVLRSINTEDDLKKAQGLD